MGECIRLARQGVGFVEPNPCVGAVVVQEGGIVGRGFHSSLGGPHAEVVALLEAGEASFGADLYVSLEPCSTTGRTPPCTQAIMDSGIKKVVIGALDPNPKHAGRAIPLLESAGIGVVTGVLAEDSQRLIENFALGLQSTRPIVVAKWASTLDGKIATRTGDSRWITNKPARIAVHEERARCDAILVGVSTVLADNPALTVRHVEGASPRPVILDSTLRTPEDALVVTAAQQAPLIYCRNDAEAERAKRLEAHGAVVVPCPPQETGVDVHAVLTDLKSRGIGRVLIEGGPRVLGSFFAAKSVDLILAFVAPKILGDGSGMAAIVGRDVELIADTIDCEWLHVDQIGPDIRLIGRCL